MNDVYLIKGETLTAIADAIRTNAPDNYEGYVMIPEEMPDAIRNVRQEGFDDGYAEGKKNSGVDLEALEELCEWMLTSDSMSNPMITIFNRHPSYYMHGVIGVRDWRFGGALENTNFVLAPNASNSYTPLKSGNVSYSEVQFNIEDVRWRASAT